MSRGDLGDGICTAKLTSGPASQPHSVCAPGMLQYFSQRSSRTATNWTLRARIFFILFQHGNLERANKLLQ